MTSQVFDAIVIGGGLAGSATGILLKEKGWNVLILEKTRFPRNKVCGEFLSPGVWPLLDRCGISQEIGLAKGASISKVSFTRAGTPAVETNLPQFDSDSRLGYGLSRERLDTLLLKKAGEHGSRVLQNHEVRHILRQEDGFGVETFDFLKKRSEVFRSRYVVNAAGNFNRWKEIHRPFSHLWREKKICFKAHFRGPSTQGAVKLLFFRGGYMGMVEVEDGIVNLCGTVRKEVLKLVRFDFDQLLPIIGKEHKPFESWIASAKRLSPWLSCGPQQHEFRRGYQKGIFYVGDAACTLEPLMGQGMLMSFASAFLLSSILTQASPEERCDQLGERYQRNLKRVYDSKMRPGCLLNFFLEYLPNAFWGLFTKKKALPLISFLIEKTCELPDEILSILYRNTLLGDDAPQWQRSTARALAETLR